MNKVIYLISGLGADERIFRNLCFPFGYDVRFLPWIPAAPDEPLYSYAARMAAGITEDAPVILGVSFGGMMGLEIARQRPVSRTILISSIKHRREKPPYYNLARKLRLHRLPDSLLYKRRSGIVRYFLQAETPEEKMLVKDYLSRKDYRFTRWAVNTILHWQNETVPESVVHIHGTRDMPFPMYLIQPTHIIRGGGHFMVLNRAAEINEILATVLV